MAHLDRAHRKTILSIIAVSMVMSFTNSFLNVEYHVEDLTFVAGIISQNTTWTLSGSPYVVAGNLNCRARS